MGKKAVGMSTKEQNIGFNLGGKHKVKEISVYMNEWSSISFHLV
jgi:hypothetical protein